MPGHPAIRISSLPSQKKCGWDSERRVIRCNMVTGDRRQADNAPSLGQISSKEEKSRRGLPGRAEEAVIAMTGIKEAAKNEWTSNVRCCISRAAGSAYCA